MSKSLNRLPYHQNVDPL